MQKTLFFALSLLFSSVSLAAPPAGVPAAPPALNGITSGELKWNGTINPACNLQNFVDGIVVPSVDQTQVSSKFSGGQPATMQMFANSNGYNAILGNPILIGPSGQMSDVSITLDPVALGVALDGTNVPQFGPNGQGAFIFNGGTYNVSADATATRNSGSFDAGTYVLRVPVSCVHI